MAKIILLNTESEIKQEVKPAEIRKQSVKYMPKFDRPREKMFTRGTNSMDDYELLAILLRTGTKDEPVMDLAQNLIRKFGNLEKLFEASLQDLMDYKGIGLAKACEIVSCITLAKRYRKEREQNENIRLNRSSVTEAKVAVDFIREMIEDYSKEQFYVLNFDVRNRVIDVEQISKGTLTASLVHPRETFESAIRKHAASIMVAHNHPSGDLQPSEEDIRITRRLKDAGNILGIQLLDHIIITKLGFRSLKEMGIL